MEKRHKNSHCSAPRWLTLEYFQHLVSQKYEQTTVTKVTCPDWTVNGIETINTLQYLLELLAPSGTENTSYQVRHGVFGPLAPHYVERVLGTEVRVLSEIIPVMERLLTNIYSGKYVPLASALVDYCEDCLYNIIEDDLKSNFTILAKEKGVDLKHCMAFMRFLAVFHASSIPALKEISEDILDNPLLPEVEDWYSIDDAINASLTGVIAQLELWDDGHVWLEKIRKLKLRGKLVDRYGKAHRRQPDRFRVLLHGQPSGKRVLFRDEPESPECSVRLLGFEFARVGSFADDILHFIYRAASDEVLESHTDLLVEEYRTAFNEALDLLGLRDEKLLSPEDVRTELYTQRAVALVMAFHELPHVRTPGYLKEETSHRTYEVVYGTPEYTKLLRTLLVLFESRGWLDGFDDISEEDQASSSSVPVT